MNRIAKLPMTFARYKKMGGVLDFSAFDDTAGTEAEVLLAIQQTLRKKASFDAERLRSIGCRSITEEEFFGDWYDPKHGSLLRLGDWRTADGRTLTDPALRSLDGVQILSGGSTCVEAGGGGEFAYAFSKPPYGLQARPSEVQAVFNRIVNYLLPPQYRNEISDWSSPLLPEVSDYFDAGMEWWGVFLFSIYTPEIRRLSIVAGSTTD